MINFLLDASSQNDYIWWIIYLTIIPILWNRQSLSPCYKCYIWASREVKNLHKTMLLLYYKLDIKKKLSD